MTQSLSINVSGPAFSLLFYENVRSNYDQEGFLLGEVCERKTKTVTDYDQQVVNTERIIIVNRAVPCPNKCYFYNAAGKIDTKAISDLLGDQMEKVVAWYKFKYTSGFKMTLREKIIHKQLSNFFTIPMEFSCCLLTADTKNRMAYSYTQLFVRYFDGAYERIPMHIINLSDPNNAYKVAGPVSETFNKLVKPINAGSNKTPGLAVIKRIQNAVQKHIDQVIVNLAKSEKELFALEAEVKELQQNLKWKNECNISGSSESVLNGEDDNRKSVEIIESSSKESSPECSQNNTKGRITRQTSRGKMSSSSSSSRSPTKEPDDVNEQARGTSYPKTRSATKSNVTYSQITQKNKH